MEGKNLQDAFSNPELSEQSRKALQSETWQKAREAMGADAPGIKADASARTERNDEFHHGDWKAVLHEYVRTAYKSGKSVHGITSGGTVYQFMEKDDKVTFYDADGNTLFHVGYEQLDKEYAEMMERQGTESADCQIKKEVEEGGEEGIKCSGDIGEKCDKYEPVQSEDSGAEDMDKDHALVNPPGGKETSGPVKSHAEKKLKNELKKAKDKSFAEPVIEYLIKRCGEDEGLSQDVIQEHKTWEKCYGYLNSKAQKSAQKGAICCAMRDDVVYEWAEDYYHKDDKAEEEKKARKAAEAKKKAEERKAKAKEDPAKKAAREKEHHGTKAPDKTEAALDVPKKDYAKPKKNARDIEGQMDMFSMMGM